MSGGKKGPVAIIGVGNMGGGMAANLLARGWQVQVCDVNPVAVQVSEDKGAVQRSTPHLCAMNCVATIVCVVDAVQAEDVLFGSEGAVQAMPAGHAVLLCPTIAPASVEWLAKRLSDRHVHAIDAPMSGGPVRASDGSMSLMVACPDAVFEAHRELIDALSSKVFRISERPGDGARTKLVNNLLAGINLVGAAEAMALAMRMGLDPGRTLDVVEQSSGQSWIGTDRMRRAIAGDFAPRAHMTLLEKDTRLALEVAAASGFTGPLGTAAQETFARAARQGLAGRDDAALLQLLTRSGQ